MNVVAASGVPLSPPGRAPLQHGASQAQWREPSAVLGSSDFARQPPPASSSSSSIGASPSTGAYGALSSYPMLGRAASVRGDTTVPLSQSEARPPPSVEDEDIFGVLSTLNDDRSAPLPHSVLDVSPPWRPQPPLSSSRGPALQAVRSQRGLWQPSDDPQQDVAHPPSSNATATAAAAASGLSPRAAPARPSVQPGRPVPPVTRSISPTPHEPHVLLPMPPTRPSPLSVGSFDVVAIARLRGAAALRRDDLASPALSGHTPPRDAGVLSASAPRSSSQFHSPGYAAAPASSSGSGGLAEEDDVLDSIRSPYLSWKGSHPRLPLAHGPSPGSLGRGVHHPSLLRSPQAVGGALGDTAGDLWGILYDDP